MLGNRLDGSEKRFLSLGLLLYYSMYRTTPALRTINSLKSRAHRDAFSFTRLERVPYTGVRAHRAARQAAQAAAAERPRAERRADGPRARRETREASDETLMDTCAECGR